VSDDIELPVDSTPSRIRPKRTTAMPPLGDDPDDIGTVDRKINAFREDYPDGVIEPEMDTRIDVLGIATYTASARVYKNADDTRPVATAHATRTSGVGEEPFASRALETAESVAIGRALRFMGYAE